MLIFILRYEKFTITGLKAKVEQYEKENQQLKKALQNSDKYVEQLQMELRMWKAKNAESEARTGVQDDSEARDTSAEINREEIVPNSIVSQSEPAVASPLNHSSSTELQSCTVVSPMSTQQEKEENSLAQNDVATASESGECSRDLFPATKKLLALKKIHETRTSPSSQSPNVHHVSPVSAIDVVPWSSGVSYANYDSPSDSDKEISIPSDRTPPQQSSETLARSFAQSESSENASNNVILTAAGLLPLPLCTSEQTNFDQSSKRSTPTESCLLNKKIKVEKD
jgi:hypothetical protein